VKYCHSDLVSQTNMLEYPPVSRSITITLLQLAIAFIFFMQICKCSC